MPPGRWSAGSPARPIWIARCSSVPATRWVPLRCSITLGSTRWCGSRRSCSRRIASPATPPRRCSSAWSLPDIMAGRTGGASMITRSIRRSRPSWGLGSRPVSGETMFGYDWPRLHAALNDLPTALLLTAVFFDVVAAITKRPGFRQVSFWTLIVGAVGGAAAVISGLQAEGHIEHGEAVHELMETHEKLALITLGVFAVLT